MYWSEPVPIVDLARLNAPVQALMRRAGEVAIKPRFGLLRQEHLTTKSGNDHVTIADLDSEAILIEGLSKLLPEASIVAEEAVHADNLVTKRLVDDLCWVVDPLDGTNNFAGGTPPFGIMVALAHAGHTLAGWIYDPLVGRCCYASLNGGAFVNGVTVHSTGTQGVRPVAAISMARVDPTRLSALQASLESTYTIVDTPRCAAEQYPRIALGQNDLAFFNRTSAWDHAAGALFLEEAGGRVRRYDGSRYRLDDDKSGLLAASTPELWEAAAEMLRKLK